MFATRHRRSLDATAQPIRDGGPYIARHGHGYSRFEHQANGVALDLLQYVPLADPIKISRLTIRNLSDRPRRLSVTAYAEWVLGISRGAFGAVFVTEIDAATGAMLARNPWNIAFSGAVAFVDLGGRQTAWTADRSEFLGRNGTPASLRRSPEHSAVRQDRRRPRSLRRPAERIELGVGETIEVVGFLGQCRTIRRRVALIDPLSRGRPRRRSREVTEHWRHVAGQGEGQDAGPGDGHHAERLAAVSDARLPHLGALGLLSGQRRLRLPRSAAGRHGAWPWPSRTRRGAICCAPPRGNSSKATFSIGGSRQSGQGVRTRISDDRVWLAFATAANYVEFSGDGGGAG